MQELILKSSFLGDIMTYCRHRTGSCVGGGGGDDDLMIILFASNQAASFLESKKNLKSSKKNKLCHCFMLCLRLQTQPDP